MRNKGMYIYQAEGHLYLLKPEFMVGISRIRLIGAGIHDKDGEYLGYWDRYNMPVAVIKGLTAWTKEAYSLEIASRRFKLMDQRRRGAKDMEI